MYFVHVKGEKSSSTCLCKALDERGGEELVEELKSMAINPRLFVEMGETEMAKLKGDSKLQDFISSGVRLEESGATKKTEAVTQRDTRAAEVAKH